MSMQNNKIPTPHISAKAGEIAKCVIMPGDPLRAKWIAEKFLKNVKQFNNVRGMLGFTGTYNGKEVSVMGHGMGMPSIGIYSSELYMFYGVEKIIRVGSAGALVKELEVRDTILATSSSTNSNYCRAYGVEVVDVSYPSEALNKTLESCAKENNIKLMKGKVFSNDTFYSHESLADMIESTKGAVAVEMEAFALFTIAKKLNKQAAVLLTISDSLITGSSLPAEDRQSTFSDMVVVALNGATK